MGKGLSPGPSLLLSGMRGALSCLSSFQPQGLLLPNCSLLFAKSWINLVMDEAEIISDLDLFTLRVPKGSLSALIRELEWNCGCIDSKLKVWTVKT